MLYSCALLWLSVVIGGAAKNLQPCPEGTQCLRLGDGSSVLQKKTKLGTITPQEQAPPRTPTSSTEEEKPTLMRKTAEENPAPGKLQKDENEEKGLPRKSPTPSQEKIATMQVHGNKSLKKIAHQLLVDPVSAATGSLFSGNPFRTYDGPLHYHGRGLGDKTAYSSGKFPSLEKACNNWAVVTTINPPTVAVKSVARLPNWCLVIVGDTKTPQDYLQSAGLADRDDILYLSAIDQQLITDSFVQSVPFNSFARKNVGFLLAIKHGAKVIFDFDDDNLLLTHNYTDSGVVSALASNESSLLKVRLLDVGDKPIPVFNPLPLMKPTKDRVWPRGFPLTQVTNTSASGMGRKVSLGTIPRSSIGVVQAVCNVDPDVDAVYRLTRNHSFSFNAKPSALNLLIPAGSFAPYNAQATVHNYKAFWGLLLPHTVPGRVTDIWRAYFTERIMQDLQLAVVYAPPLVLHQRSHHNFLADFIAEKDLYIKTNTLLQFLQDWRDVSPSVPARLENLWVALYERGYIELADVKAMQLWLAGLINVGYEFPSLNSQSPLVLVAEPALHGQPYLATPAYNLGGPNGAQSYAEFLESVPEANWDSWQEWLEGNKKVAIARPEGTVVKLILMTKDEWPLLRTWVLYHGALIGFEHLYVLDGSSDPRCTEFLVHAKDQWGLNVVSSPSNLNGLETEMTAMARELAKASDFLMKVDTDEFLAAIPASCSEGSAQADSSCAIRPDAVADVLAQPPAGDGRQMFSAWTCGSVINDELCNEGKQEEVGLFTFQCEASPMFKSVYDARTVTTINLGGHVVSDDILPPWNGVPATASRFGFFHLHSRCKWQVAAQCRMVMVSHGYISDDWTDEQVLQNYHEKLGDIDFCTTEFQQLGDMLANLGQLNSFHKVILYLRFVLKCQQDDNPGQSFPSPTFQQFVADATAKYS